MPSGRRPSQMVGSGFRLALQKEIGKYFARSCGFQRIELRGGRFWKGSDWENAGYQWTTSRRDLGQSRAPSTTGWPGAAWMPAWTPSMPTLRSEPVGLSATPNGSARRRTRAGGQRSPALESPSAFGPMGRRNPFAKLGPCPNSKSPQPHERSRRTRQNQQAA